MTSEKFIAQAINEIWKDRMLRLISALEFQIVHPSIREQIKKWAEE